MTIALSRRYVQIAYPKKDERDRQEANEEGDLRMHQTTMVAAALGYLLSALRDTAMAWDALAGPEKGLITNAVNAGLDRRFVLR